MIYQIVVGTYYPAQTGGPDNAVYWLAKGLSENNFEVSTITSSYGIKQGIVPIDTWTKNEGGKVIYLYLKNNLRPMYWWLRVARLIIRYESNVLHLNSLVYSFPFVFLFPFLNRTIIWSVHGELYEYAKSSGRSGLKRFLWSIIRLYQRKIVFHSTCEKETLSIKETIGENAKIIEIPIGFDIPEKLSTDQSEKYLSFIGRIDPIKGLDLLITALSKSHAFMESEFTLKIAGSTDTNYTSKLLALVKELNMESKIEFVGHVSGSRKNEFLASAYFNFLTSHSENFGVVVLEALAQGTPVVASKGTPWRLLETEKAGYWINADIESLKSVIDDILTLTSEEYALMQEQAIKVPIQFEIRGINRKWAREIKEMVKV